LETVRNALENLLLTALQGTSNGFALRAARPLTPFERMLLANYAGMEPPGSPLRDYVLLSVLSGRDPQALLTRVAAEIRPAFRRARTLAACVGLAAALVTAGVIAMPPGPEPAGTVVTQFVTDAPVLGSVAVRPASEPAITSFTVEADPATDQLNATITFNQPLAEAAVRPERFQVELRRAAARTPLIVVKATRGTAKNTLQLALKVTGTFASGDSLFVAIRELAFRVDGRNVLAPLMTANYRPRAADQGSYRWLTGYLVKTPLGYFLVNEVVTPLDLKRLRTEENQSLLWRSGLVIRTFGQLQRGRLEVTAFFDEPAAPKELSDADFYQNVGTGETTLVVFWRNGSEESLELLASAWRTWRDRRPTARVFSLEMNRNPETPRRLGISEPMLRWFNTKTPEESNQAR
jgi:hypothetical protein